MDLISYLIIFRALFIFLLLEKGWCVKKIKKNTYETFKSVKRT
jgi:hypothetical protein